MSILIKGMDMPKDIEPGLAIEFADGIDGKRYARLYHYRYGGLTEWLEAVSVTPTHGRLGDMDALMLEIKEYIEEYGELDENGYHNLKWCAMKEAEAKIENAPTVIEAEGEE